MDWSSLIAMGQDASGTLKTISEVVKNIRDMRSSAKPDAQKIVDTALETLRDKVTELQQKQFDLQNLAFSLSQENLTMTQAYRAALDELAHFKQFEADRENYERITFALNTAAYREKVFQGAADDQPLLCPNCFDKSKKTYLSFQEHAPQTKHMKCTVCSTSVHIARNDGPVVMTASVNRGRDFFDF